MNYSLFQYNVDDLLNSSLNYTSFNQNMNNISNISYKYSIYEIANLSFVKNKNTFNFTPMEI